MQLVHRHTDQAKEGRSAANLMDNHAKTAQLAHSSDKWCKNTALRHIPTENATNAIVYCAHKRSVGEANAQFVYIKMPQPATSHFNGHQNIYLSSALFSFSFVPTKILRSLNLSSDTRRTLALIKPLEKTLKANERIIWCLQPQLFADSYILLRAMVKLLFFLFEFWLHSLLQ